MNDIRGSIRRIVSDNGFSRKDLSERTGIPIGALNRIMNKKRELHITELVSLCKALNQTPEEVYGYQGGSSGETEPDSSPAPGSTITFGVFADLDNHMMFDCHKRVEAFIKKARAKNVDFIIQLGDFVFNPAARNKLTPQSSFSPKNAGPLAPNQKESEQLLYSAGIPVYNVIGNQEMVRCNKREILDYLGLEKGYYSFDIKGFHFAVLDGNFVLKDGEYIDYAYNNNLSTATQKAPYLGEEQLAWLERDLSACAHPAVLFCHQRLDGSGPSVQDWKKLHQLLCRMRGNGKRIFMCVSGESHTDSFKRVGENYFWEVNSISYIYLDEEEFTYHDYPPEFLEKFPHLPHLVPYKDPLFAFVTLNGNGSVRIEGKISSFFGPSPEERGHPGIWSGDAITPDILSRNFTAW